MRLGILIFPVPSLVALAVLNVLGVMGVLGVQSVLGVLGVLNVMGNFEEDNKATQWQAEKRP